MVIKARFKRVLETVHGWWLDPIRYILSALLILGGVIAIILLMAHMKGVDVDRAMWFAGGSGFIVLVGKIYHGFKS